MGTFRTERAIVYGKPMKRCTGVFGEPCPDSAWIDDIRRNCKCKKCERAWAREWERKDRKTSKKDFKNCTDQEAEALRTGNVELLLKCESKGDRWEQLKQK